MLSAADQVDLSDRLRAGPTSSVLAWAEARVLDLDLVHRVRWRLRAPSEAAASAGSDLARPALVLLDGLARVPSDPADAVAVLRAAADRGLPAAPSSVRAAAEALLEAYSARPPLAWATRRGTNGAAGAGPWRHAILRRACYSRAARDLARLGDVRTP